MSLASYVKGKYEGMDSGNKLATVAYGWNITPYIPAIVLNTASKYVEGFEGIANGLSNLSTSNFDPVPALGFGLLKVLDNINEAVGNNKYVNFTKTFFGGAYGTFALTNVANMFVSDTTIGDLVNLTSNALISASLLYDMKDSLRRRNVAQREGLSEEQIGNLEKITLFSDVKEVGKDIENVLDFGESVKNYFTPPHFVEEEDEGNFLDDGPNNDPSI